MESGKFKSRVRHRDNAIRKRYSGATPSKVPTSPSRPTMDGLMAPQPGTVAAMDFGPPILVSENTSIVEVARTMAGRRVDAVLVTDAEGYGELKGIVTDKDLAFRCVAEGLEPSRYRVSQIMTRNPKYVSTSAPVDEAINIMLNGHFRHLPVVDNGKIVGIVDITKVFMHIESKIQNSWGKARALKAAFAEFVNSWQNFTVSSPVEAWFKDWEEKMVEPSLSSVMDYTVVVAKVGYKTNVLDAARVMRDARQTAVLVYDNDELTGIFTTKDICLRVLAPNDIEPKSTSVIRVMTPHPDCGTEDMTVKDALRKMHDGHYLHIPVLNHAGGAIVGLVDVLFLTYHTMEQLIQQQLATPTVTSQPAEQQQSGPVWSKFWEDAAPGDSYVDPDYSRGSYQHAGGLVGAAADRSMTMSSAPSVTGSQSATTVTPAVMDGSGFVFKFRDVLTGNVHRFTSTVVAAPGEDGPLAQLIANILDKCHCIMTGGVDMWTADEDNDDDDATLHNGMRNIEVRTTKRMSLLEFYQRYHYLPARPQQSPVLADIDGNVRSTDASLYFRLSYKDDENDMIGLHNDASVLDAVSLARMLGWGRVVLKVEAFVRLPSEREGGTAHMVPLVPYVGRDGCYMLSCVEESAAGDLDMTRAAPDDVDSVVHMGSSVTAFDKHPRPVGNDGRETMDLGLWVGAAGLLIGAMGVGMMVASRMRQ